MMTFMNANYGINRRKRKTSPVSDKGNNAFLAEKCVTRPGRGAGTGAAQSAYSKKNSATPSMLTKTPRTSRALMRCL